MNSSQRSKRFYREYNSSNTCTYLGSGRKQYQKDLTYIDTPVGLADLIHWAEGRCQFLMEVGSGSE